MRRVYKKPPLVEALCEFRFEPSQPWDWTIPGLIYAELKAEFPKKRERRTLELALEEGAEKTTQHFRQRFDRMQFLNEDETALVQVGDDILAVNHLRPYPHWPVFKELIARVLAIYREVAKPQAFRRIGLRYINRLEIPQQGKFDVEEYLTAVPRLPETLPQTLVRWLQRTDLPLEEIDGLLTVQTASAFDEEKPQQPIFMLDLDCGTLKPDEIPLDRGMDWLETAHEQVEQAFEACITDATRNIFEGVQHAERARA